MKFYKHLFFYLGILLFMSPMQVFSVEENASEIVSEVAIINTATSNIDPMSSGYLKQLIVGLFIVLLCIIVLAWFAKKTKHFNALTNNALKVIGGLSLGSRERVVLLQVGKQQLLVGVSPGKISALHVLDTPVEMAGNLHKDSMDNLVAGTFLDKFKTAMFDVNNASEKKQNKQ